MTPEQVGTGKDRWRMDSSNYDSGTIVVLTGAGISAESGIETFRDKGGIWAQNNIENVATPEAFEQDPLRVHDFYNTRDGRLAHRISSPMRRIGRLPF